MNAAEDIVAAKVATELKPSDLVKQPKAKSRPSNGNSKPILLEDFILSNQGHWEERKKEAKTLVYVKHSIPPAVYDGIESLWSYERATRHGGLFATAPGGGRPDPELARDRLDAVRLERADAEDHLRLLRHEQSSLRNALHSDDAGLIATARAKLQEINDVVVPNMQMRLKEIVERERLAETQLRSALGDVFAPPGAAKYGSAER